MGIVGKILDFIIHLSEEAEPTEMWSLSGLAS